MITTRHDELPGGLTAVTVCLVSAESPQILDCVTDLASAHDPIGNASVFCVNILASLHRKTAERFAGMAGDDRSNDKGEWLILTTGAPVLKGCPVSFDRKMMIEVAAGTHTIDIGRIVDIVLARAALTLVYADGNFIHGEELNRLRAEMEATCKAS